MGERRERSRASSCGHKQECCARRPSQLTRPRPGVSHGRVARTPERNTVDLSQYPDLVVIYLGMRARSLRGLRTLISFGPKIRKSVDAEPDGLLLHENIVFSLLPPHLGMRQYWRDFDSLERWARSLPHQEWWQTFLRDRGGTGFWHETYPRRGEVESIYIDMPPMGMSKFAPLKQARGSMFSARRRLGLQTGDEPPPGISEEELYQS
jgi:hypothetical protein